MLEERFTHSLLVGIKKHQGVLEEACKHLLQVGLKKRRRVKTGVRTLTVAGPLKTQKRVRIGVQTLTEDGSQKKNQSVLEQACKHSLLAVLKNTKYRRVGESDQRSRTAYERL